LTIPRILLAAILISKTLSAGEAEQWPQWRGPDRNGISKEKNVNAEWPKDGPKKLWSATVGTGCSSVIVANSKVYTMGNNAVIAAKLKPTTTNDDKKPVEKSTVVEPDMDFIYCLNADTGVEVWRYGYVQPLEASGFPGGPCSTPCVDANKLYAMNKRGRVFCLDADKGTLLWDSDPQEKIGKPVSFGGMSTSPIVEGDLLIAGANAFDKMTGKVRWTLKTSCRWSSPLITTLEGKRVVITFSEKGVACADVADGTEKWFVPFPCDQAAADPILQGNELFICTRTTKAADPDTALIKFTLAGAEIIWKNKNFMSYFQVRVWHEGAVIGCDEKNLICVDFKTGEVKWTIPGCGRGQVLIAGNKLLLMLEGKLIVADVSDGAFKELSRLQVGGGGISVLPVLCGGRIYCRGSSGVNNLVCLDVSAK